MMNDLQLTGTLKSIGKACFVKYYEHADDPALHQRIRDAEGYSPVTCRTRASGIRSIIKHGRGKDALAITANSKADTETRKKAAALLAQGCPRPSAEGNAPMMNDQQLETTLRSMGKACFVKYYEHADDPALPQRIREAEPFTYKSCQSRASCLRRIIRHGRGKDALAITANSKADTETRKKAAALLAQG